MTHTHRHVSTHIHTGFENTQNTFDFLYTDNPTHRAQTSIQRPFHIGSTYFYWNYVETTLIQQCVPSWSLPSNITFIPAVWPDPVKYGSGCYATTVSFSFLPVPVEHGAHNRSYEKANRYNISKLDLICCSSVWVAHRNKVRLWVANYYHNIIVSI